MITRKPLFLSIVYTNVIYKKNGTIYYEAGTDNASETHKLATDRPTPKAQNHKMVNIPLKISAIKH